MAQKQKYYDNEFKAQAVKLAQGIGGHKAANEFGIPSGTLYTWIRAFKKGYLSANNVFHAPKTALSLNDELIELRKRVKEQDKGSHAGLLASLRNAAYNINSKLVFPEFPYF